MSSGLGRVAAYGISVEHEPIGAHQTQPTLALLLNARRCLFECVFCDLWMHNHVEATPAGAIPFQIADAIGKTFPEGVEGKKDWAIKLYNGGNFTDPLSVPESDWPSIAELCASFGRVIIENHATMCGERLLRFRDCLGTRLEVAIGLETANAKVLSLQNKKMTLEDFDRSAAFLRQHGIHLRCFAMLQLPFSDVRRSVDDATQSVRHAIEAGAGFVAIIPTRHTTPAMQDLIASGDHVPPTIGQLEQALSKSLRWARRVGSNSVVTADTWDIEKVVHCPTCQSESIENILAMNASQSPVLPISCADCGIGTGETPP